MPHNLRTFVLFHPLILISRPVCPSTTERLLHFKCQEIQKFVTPSVGNANCPTHFFQAFFGSGAMATVVETFCIYHITAPGQENGAEDLPESFQYPTMDDLSEQVSVV